MSTVAARAAGAIGAVAVVCFAVAFLADPTPPVAGSDTVTVLRHALQFSVSDRIAGFFFAASGALFVAFAAALQHVLRDASQREAFVGTIMLAGGIATGTLQVLDAVLFFTLGARAAALDGQTAATLADLATYGFVFEGFMVLVFVVAASALMLRSRGVLRVLGECGAVVSLFLTLYLVTSFFTSGALAAGGVVSIISFGVAAVWVALIGLSLLVLEPRALFGPPVATGRAS